MRSVFGYNPLEDETYNAFITSNPDPRARIYDLLNVRYVSTTTPLTLVEDDTLTLVAEESGVTVYERATALPRAWFVTGVVQADLPETVAGINRADFDPRATAFVVSGDEACPGGGAGKVTVSRRTLNTLVAEIEGEGGLVVFSERFSPGWRATVDGARAPIVRVDGLLRGVCVAAGEHSVAFDYRPPMLVVGGAISAATLLICLYLGLYRRRLSLFRREAVA